MGAINRRSENDYPERLQRTLCPYGPYSICPGRRLVGGSIRRGASTDHRPGAGIVKLTNQVEKTWELAFYIAAAFSQDAKARRRNNL